MGFIAPRPPEFDVASWRSAPYFDRLQMMCVTWAMQGFGAPGVAYVFYVLKLALYIGGFVAIAANTPGLGGLGNIGDWWADPIVFQKAVLWTLLFESLGLGCGSGPLTGRYLPPVTAVFHWLRPGTTRLPPFRHVPLTAGTTRTWFDVVLYAVFVGLVIRALAGTTMGPEVIIPIVAVFGILGLRDKTLFLAGRPEHYLLATVVFLFPDDLWSASKVVMLGLWWGAATSKLNRHFPDVIAVMMSNNPLIRSRRVRTRLYRNYPDDLRGSRLAGSIALGATVIEYSVPAILVLSGGGTVGAVALAVMIGFHLIILTSFPLGVPLEWNVFFIYSALVLFGTHGDVPAWAIGSPLLWAILAVSVVVIPVVGNLRPDKVSFLPSMRYYAGNWPTGLWVMKPGVFERIDDAMVTTARTPRRQVERLYGPGQFELVLGRTQAFRSMHLHGRALNCVLPLAASGFDDGGTNTDTLGDVEVVDGELVAGLVLGWNFGDGHLHHEQLLTAVQQACDFAPGDLRCVFVESQPLGTPVHRWRVVDAASGLLGSGMVSTKDLAALQPWDHNPGVLTINGSGSHPAT